jgi:hypothetical protein
MKTNRIINVMAIMLFLGCAMMGNAQTWNFSDNSSLTGTIADGSQVSFTVDEVTMTIAGKMTVLSTPTATVDGVEYTKSIYGDGTSNSSATKVPTRRYLSFPVSSTGTLNIIASSRNTNTNTYDVFLVKEGTITNIGNKTYTAKETPQNDEFDIPGDGTIYIHHIATKDIMFYCVTFTPALSCDPATASFASPEITKTLGDDNFTNPFTTDNTSDEVYASSDTDVATVDPASGEVTIVGPGETTISVTQEADGTLCAVEELYELTVEAPAPTFDITESSNDERLGTVSLAGAVITAVPGDCSDYADPAYTVTPSDAATVVQSGNEFTVLNVISDCAIQINFVAKPIYTVTLNPGNGELPDNTPLTQADCTASVTLPAATPGINGRVFAGWSTTEIAETTVAPALIPAGDYTPTEDITFYAVYSRTVTSDTATVLFDERFSTQTATEGSSNTGITFDETWTRGTGTLYFTEANAITLSNNVKYYTSSLDLRNPETFIEFEAKYETAPVYDASNIARSAIVVNDGGSSTNNGFQFELQADNSILFKKSASSVNGEPVFLSETQLTGEFQTFKVKINGSYVSAPLDGTDNIAIRVASSNSIPLVIKSFKVYAFITTVTYDTHPAYTITPVADGNGQVAIAGDVITATPDEGYVVSAETPFSIDPADGATVTPEGDTFTVTNLTADVTVIIHFDPATATGIGSTPAAKLKVYRNGRTVSLASESVIEKIEIYDLQGRLVYADKVNATSHILRENIAPGVYVAKVDTPNAVLNVKLIINDE